MVWSAASTDRQRPAHAFIQAHGHPAGSASRGVLSAGARGLRGAGRRTFKNRRGERLGEHRPRPWPYREQQRTASVSSKKDRRRAGHHMPRNAQQATHHTRRVRQGRGEGGGGGGGHPGATREPAVPLPSVGASPPSVSPTSSPVQASAPRRLRATGAQVEGVDFSVHYGDPAEALSSHPLLELQGHYRMVRFSRAECTNAYIRKYYSCMNKQAPRCI
eukprot:COSAG02_NODE_979_length_15497_cov_5.029549_3_plen_218_part_00